MNWKSVKDIFTSVPVLVVSLVTMCVAIEFCFDKREKVPLYKRLKKKSKRFKLRNVRFDASKIQLEGILTDRENQFFLCRISILNDEIVNVLVRNTFRCYKVRDVIILKEENLVPTCDILKKKGPLREIEYKDLKIQINCSDFEIKLIKKETVIFSMNSGNRLFIDSSSMYPGISCDFFFDKACRFYGLPQHAEELSLKRTKGHPYHLYNSDKFGYSTSDPRQALYGSVPLVYAYGKEQTTGLLWLNSSETFVDIDYNENGAKTIFYSDCGRLDVYVLLGPKLYNCVKQYAQLTGGVHLPPIFALGYHQSRFSYMSQDEVIQICNKFDENKLPLDAIWLDIDYTDEKKYFTWNPKTYPDPSALFSFLETKRRKAVTIIDPHIKIDKKYPIYKQCKDHYFVKKYLFGSFYAKRFRFLRKKCNYSDICWPGRSSWIDFYNDEAYQFYAELIKDFAVYENMHIWIDMNEPAIFNKDKSMPKDVLHSLVLNDKNDVPHRELHNMYGFLQAMGTYKGLKARGKFRPFVLTRSHFVGTQKYAAVWTGDNLATWEHLRISIPMCLTAALAGFSMCGADIGGFVGHPSDELLQRWYQLGSWLPFFRAHSNNNVPRREPYLYNIEVLTRIRKALQQRYRHLLYWYTLFWQHTLGKDPVIRPIIYNYFKDEKTLDMDQEFFVGTDILVCPVLESGASNIRAYIPSSQCWYHVADDGSFTKYKGPNFVTIPVNMNSVPVFYRSGSIIPLVEQNLSAAGYIKRCPITLHVFCYEGNTANGFLYIDDMETFNYVKKNYFYVKFSLFLATISNERLHESSYFDESVILDGVVLYGYKRAVKTVHLEIACERQERSLSVTQENDKTVIRGLSFDMKRDFRIILADQD